MAQGTFKLLRGGSKQQHGTHPKKHTTEVAAHMVTMRHSSSLFNNGPTAHWVGLETLVSLVMEGREVTAMADSSSQVNTMTPNYVKCHEFPVLPLEDLVDHPLKPDRVGWHKDKSYGVCHLAGPGDGDHWL